MKKELSLLFFYIFKNIFATLIPLMPPSTQQLQQDVDHLAKNINTPLVSGQYEVAVATSLPLKGEATIMAQDILDGMQLYFNKMKQLQPPLNFFVNLSALNDSSAIRISRINIEKLKKQTPIFLSLFGSNSTECALKSLKNNEILSMFPIEGTSFTRNQVLKNQIFLRADHKSEIRALINFLVGSLNKKKIAIFYEDSDWGNDVLQSAIKILEENNLKPVSTSSYQEKTVNISAAVKNISSFSPSAVLCVAKARPAYNFICQAMNQGLHKTTFAGLSNLFWIQKTLKESRGITVLLSSVVPSPFKSELGIVKEYREDMKKYLPNKRISPFIFEGYLNAFVFCAILQTVGFPLTLEKILKTIEGLKKFKLITNVKSEKDMTFKLDPETRCLLKNRVWLNTGINKKWKIDKGL